MKLTLQRGIFTAESSIGKLSINDVFECDTLEDFDRGLKQTMDPAEIAKIKVFGKTAIPAGTYEVVIKWSAKHGRMLPHLLNVPGYGEIEIHPGNSAVDTLGCILVGESESTNWISSSVAAFDKLFAKLQAVPPTEKIFITIISNKSS